MVKTAGVTFASSTGEPDSGKCYVCGEPSNFANFLPKLRQITSLHQQDVVCFLFWVVCGLS